jgi:diguanylate cyclase (GGDEF)-like protein/PAS domain S-box-containing protein
MRIVNITKTLRDLLPRTTLELTRIDWSQPHIRDAIIVAGIALAAFGVVEWFDVFNEIVRVHGVYGDRALDGLVTMFVVLTFALAGYVLRRLHDLGKETDARHEAEAEVRRKVEQLTRTQAFLNTIVEHVPAAIFVRDLPECRFVLVNRDGEKLLGRSESELLGRTVFDIFPVAAARRIQEHDRTQMRSHEPVLFEEVPLPTPNNGTRVTIATGLAIRDERGEPQYLVNVVEDITERKDAEARIARLAHYDPLTDLPNRSSFKACLEETVERVAAKGQKFALLCMDLDRFKEVNDVFGHAVGDGLLLEIGKRLQAAAEGAFVGRLGGDEFIVICADGPQPATAVAAGERILQSIGGDIEVAGHLLRAGISIGVAVYPADGADASILLANADAALYRAKADGRGSMRFFAPEMDKRLRERRALQHDLRSALAHGELRLFYQPQASIDGQIDGFEALVRWQHPVRGMIMPREFIPLAEESGLIIPIGAWILREACREAATWPNPLRIAVNLSPVQFRHGDLPALVHTTLLESGLTPSRLEIEITEGVLIDDFARGVSMLQRLKTLGIRIAMDDFGTGYSSLSYLQSFPFDKIKIDRAFIANLERSQQAVAIIRAVIGLGRGLDLPVVAEGVETKEQVAFLQREACSQIQGYFVGRPAPIDQYAECVGRAPTADAKALAG